MHSQTRKIALCSVLIALAMILSYIEAILPFSLMIPGIKLGIANLVIVWLLYVADFKSAFIVSFLRIFLTGLLFSNMYTFLFSICGGMLSIICMYLFKRSDTFSVYGVSVIGGVTHNIGQLIIACILFDTYAFSYYLPILMIAGILCGLMIGFISNILIKRVGFLWK